MRRHRTLAIPDQSIAHPLVSRAIGCRKEERARDDVDVRELLEEALGEALEAEPVGTVARELLRTPAQVS